MEKNKNATKIAMRMKNGKKLWKNCRQTEKKWQKSDHYLLQADA